MTGPRPGLSWSDLAGARVGVWGLGREGHANLRKLRALAATFLALLGAGAKPFECVGEVTECRAAVLLAARREDRAGQGLLAELAREVASWPDAPSEAEAAAMLRPVGRSFVPAGYR